MPYGAHETMEAHEILNEKINLINHFGLYMEQAQNATLRQMIERQLHFAMQRYDELLNYTHNYQTPQSSNAMHHVMNAQPQQIQYGLNQPQPQMPQMQGRLNDSQIAMAVLSCHKNSARVHMTAALECADPNLRQMLVNGAVACADQAYEVFMFMNKQGLYQVPTMNNHTAKTFLHAYQPVNPQQMGMTHMMAEENARARTAGMDMQGSVGLQRAMDHQMMNYQNQQQRQ